MTMIRVIVVSFLIFIFSCKKSEPVTPANQNSIDTLTYILDKIGGTYSGEAYYVFWHAGYPNDSTKINDTLHIKKLTGDTISVNENKLYYRDHYTNSYFFSMSSNPNYPVQAQTTYYLYYYPEKDSVCFNIYYPGGGHGGGTYSNYNSLKIH